MARLRRALACILISLALAGCSAATDPNATPVGDPAPSAPGERLAATESLELDLSFVLLTQICDEDGGGFVPVFVAQGTEKKLRLVDNQTRLALAFTWESANPMAQRLHFSVVGSGGEGVGVRGTSPLHFEVGPEDLPKLGRAPNVYVRPACTLPVLVASNPDTRVRVDAHHYAVTP